ncbi:MAG: calcium-translocating P-type ATPase, PMCA-type [Bacteroidales bacterium]|nr:calcium-translocating P-type ATPase, PMCA-type [Candidatus Colimorpha onthohippi]
MGQEKHHYTGLTDEQVLQSRQRYGANILTPPEEQSIWDKIKDCMHFWLLRVILILGVVSALVVIVMPMLGISMPNNVWVGPIILGVLFLLTYLVAYLGGDWDDEERKFDMDPLITILMAALVLSGAITFYQVVWGGAIGWGPYFEPLGIAIAVLLATGVAHILEASNEKTFKSLNQVNDDTLVKVIRNNNVCQVPRKDIVVGDIVLLSTGEEVPADCELLEALTLNLNESTLTGEPSCHKTTNEADFDKEATYPSNHVMKGTTILEGYCTAKVFAVGDKTACGEVFEAAQVKEGDPTPLSQKLDGLADLITKASYVIAGLIIVGRLIMYFIHPDGAFDAVNFVKYTLDTIMIAVTLIVVAVPEGLPMAVTLSLAFSMKRLMEQNTLPRTMHACETMGATSVICTDKTGTLTQNQMQVHEVYFPELNGQKLGSDEFSRLVAESIGSNTTANLDFSDEKKIKAIGSPTEGALLLWMNANGVKYLDIRESVEVKDRIPFSTEIKYMATIVRSMVLNRRVLYVTGAPDILLNLCGVSGEERTMFEEKLFGYQSQAKRTLGLAYAVLKDDDNVILDGKLIDTCSLKMMGVVAISDPIRPEVPGAIKECLDAGIQVKIVTGDTVGTAKEIGRQVGLWNDGDDDENILFGPEIQNMSDDELKSRLPKVKIISRARPNDKERVVRMLKEMDEVVAVTGDGTNDAPALNVAHVGLSMGDGTAVAKEASDMTILDNSFSTIANAVMWGRSLYKNIKRFILFQMTVNVTACFIVLVGAFIGTESPLTVTQMLWVNLIMDTFAALALASLPPTRKVMSEKPRSIEEHILKGIGGSILGVGLTFAFICLAFLLYFQHNDVTNLSSMLNLSWGEFNGLTPMELGLFFTIFVMLHFWYMFNAKAFMTTDSAFKGLSWSKTRWFIIITTVIFVVQILLVEVPGLQEMFNVAKGGLGFTNWMIIIFGTSMVMWLGELDHLFKKLGK